MLARRFGARTWPALLAGGLFLMAPYKLTHAEHLHLIALGYAALAVAFFDRLCERGRPRDGLLLAAMYALAFLTSFYNG